MEKHRKFGGKQIGAGRPALPPEQKKRRIAVYLDPLVAEWIETMGGSQFACRLIGDNFNNYVQKALTNYVQNAKK